MFQLGVIILVSGLDGGMQSSAKDLYWFWLIMSGNLLGPRILSLLLVLCCSTKAIIFCLRSLSESIHKWILGIYTFSLLKVERHFWRDPMQMKTSWFNLAEDKILVKLFQRNPVVCTCDKLSSSKNKYFLILLKAATNFNVKSWQKGVHWTVRKMEEPLKFYERCIPI